MGCTSSKKLRIREEYEEWNAPLLRSARIPVSHRRWKRKESHHFVALTSTTYGVLRLLDAPDQHSAESKPAQAAEESRKAPKNRPKACFFPEIGCALEEHNACKQEIINTVELLAGLDEDSSPLFSSIAWCKAKMYTRSFSLSSIQAVHKLDAALKRHAKPSVVLTKYYSCISKPKTHCLHECAAETSKPWADDASPDQCFFPSADCNCKRSSSKKKSKRTATSPCTPPPSTLVQKFGLCGASIPSKEKASKSMLEERKLIDKESFPLMSIENTICNHTPPASNKCTAKKTAKKKRFTPEKSGRKGCYGENLSPQLTLSKSFHILSGDRLEEIKSPLFDPELLENFERAIEQIGSDEKWLSSTLVPNSIIPITWSHEDEATKQTGKYFTLSAGRSTSKSDKILMDHLAAGNELERTEFCELYHKTKEDAWGNDHHHVVGKLQSFPWMCPPAGEQCVVLYSTSLHGIRKTYEDCINLQAMLRGFGVHVDERDVSMHSSFLQELKDLMREKSVTIPRLFIKGHYIGGVEEARLLHEEGKLAKLLEGIRKEDSSSICDGCGGMRFIPCLDCSGSCKIVSDKKEAIRCPDCNENGLIRCPICC